MAQRSVIVGDVHGCARELQILLEHLQPGPDDEVIFVGDLINKGPDSHEVLRIARELGARSTMGNHEYRLLQYRKTGDKAFLKKGDSETAASLDKADWEYLESMPLTIELPRHNALVVHGGFLPDTPWREQTAEVVTRIQVVDKEGNAAKSSKAPNGTPWAALWNGPEFVVYGHRPRRRVARRPHSIGLDTGCVHGGSLSALIFPHRILCQVPAKAAYGKRRF